MEANTNTKTPVSKSQLRALRLLNLPASDLYAVAADTLDAAGYRRDGIPQGETWRTAAKLSDAALLAAIKVEIETESIDRY